MSSDAADDRDLARDVTVIIKTYERPLCVAHLVLSIRRYFPTVPVLVCDDGRQPLYADRAMPLPGVVWLNKPHAEGHTAGGGRNFLIDRVTTGYYFQCDDDHVFTARTNLPAMRHFLDTSGYDLVGGCQGRWDYGTARQVRDGGVLRILAYAHNGVIAPGVADADRVSNTFLARTETMRPVRWEDRVNANTHSDYFLRAREAGKRIAQMGGVHVLHARGCEASTSMTDRLKGLSMGHADPRYRLARLGAQEGDTEAAAEEAHWRRHRRFVLEKNGLDAMRDDSSLIRLLGLYREIGHPSLGTVRYAAANDLAQTLGA